MSLSNHEVGRVEASATPSWFDRLTMRATEADTPAEKTKGARLDAFISSLIGRLVRY
jgi:hypothetical protein